MFEYSTKPLLFRETVWMNAYCTSLGMDRHESTCARDADSCLKAFDMRFPSGEEQPAT